MDHEHEWDARPVGRLRLAPILRWVALGTLGALGVLVTVGALTVLMIATYPGSGADRDRRNGPALAAGAAEAVPRLAAAIPVARPTPLAEDGCNGRETLCATVATDDPGATLQQLGAAWRHGKTKRFRLRVTVAPEQP